MTILIGLYFTPKAPLNMSVLDQNDQQYFAVCPNLENIEKEPLSSALGKTFSLLNWNIYKQQNKNWFKKLDEWSKQADFITLQEAKYDQALINFHDQQQFYDLQNIAFIYQQQHFGVNTASRVQALQVCGTRYSEPWLQVPKTGLASTYAIQNSNKKLLIINLHGVNFTITSTPLKEQVTPYLLLIKQHQGPVIISGDFNTWSEARSKEIIEALIKQGFNEALFSKDQRLKIFGRPLDHIFYRDLDLVSSQSITTTASDHTPQLVTFSLN